MDIINYIIDFSTNYIYTGGIFFGIFLLFIENIPQYTMYNVVIWCIIGFAFSPELCEIKEMEISKLFLKKKLNEQLGEN